MSETVSEREQLRRRILLTAGDNLRRYAEEDGTPLDRCLQCDMGVAVRQPNIYDVDGVACCSACGRRMVRPRLRVVAP